MCSPTELIDRLRRDRSLEKSGYIRLLHLSGDDAEYLRRSAEEVRLENYGRAVYTRGLIEFTNYCKQNCFYCGIRRDNAHCSRYRLTDEEILNCCDNGYNLGFRTFVLQGGEDPYFNDDRICALIERIKELHPDCAITLSIGEKSRESYRRFFDCGADRYLLRHETANALHYGRLHPPSQTLAKRMECLYTLKEIGFQTGCGFMVGSPFQTDECISDDLDFIKKLNPQMIGIGPFIPHAQTPFGDHPSGSVQLTLTLLSIIRLMIPQVLLPATTALATLDPNGREKGILAGANVVMPNLSPVSAKKKYSLYDNKVCTGDESAECVRCLGNRMESIGYHIVIDRGDSKVV